LSRFLAQGPVPGWEIDRVSLKKCAGPAGKMGMVKKFTQEFGLFFEIRIKSEGLRIS
jgi:hypothetical protein